ncbi:MAG: hypothetical protein LBH98_00660, partial [Chitinispirillales bacterium]|nr:hypothetical protein [Chitinispirillales bacterium]
MESKETKEEKEFYEWAQKTLEISREKIAKNERLSKACETVIDAACNNRIEYGDNKIVYKLKHPVGDIKEVT